MSEKYHVDGPIDVSADVDGVSSVTWWGCGAVELTVDGTTLAIDPYLNPTEDVDFIFCTHEHYDHCHVPTIHQLQEDETFDGLYVSRSCVLPSTHFYAAPEVPLDKELEPTVLYPEHYQHYDFNGLPKWDDAGKLGGSPPTSVEVGPFQVTAVEAPGEEADLPSYSAVSGPIAQLGYLITDTINDVTYYHTGDLRLPYPEMCEFDVDVDVVFYPPGKVYSHDHDPLEYQLASDAFTLELFNPEYLVPVHYRHDDYPVPKEYDESEPIEVQVTKHQFPTIDNPDEYFEGLQSRIESLGIEVLPIAAGEEYDII